MPFRSHDEQPASTPADGATPEVDGAAGAGTVVVLEESPGVKIPDDDDAGIERQLTCDVDGAVNDVAVSVDIAHTFVQDLIVELTSPAGTRVFLRQESGGSASNVVETYRPDATPGLAQLLGEPSQGPWKLHVSDRSGWFRGKLNRWRLRLVIG